MAVKQNWLTISNDGTVRIPAEILAKYGLKSGDEVAVVETESGLLVGSREQILEQLLSQMGEQIQSTYDHLSEDEVIEQLMQKGRHTIRPQLLKELYDIDE